MPAPFSAEFEYLVFSWLHRIWVLVQWKSLWKARSGEEKLPLTQQQPTGPGVGREPEPTAHSSLGESAPTGRPWLGHTLQHASIVCAWCVPVATTWLCPPLLILGAAASPSGLSGSGGVWAGRGPEASQSASHPGGWCPVLHPARVLVPLGGWDQCLAGHQPHFKV